MVLPLCLNSQHVCPLVVFGIIVLNCLAEQFSSSEKLFSESMFYRAALQNDSTLSFLKKLFLYRIKACSSKQNCLWVKQFRRPKYRFHTFDKKYNYVALSYYIHCSFGNMPT